MSIEKNNGKIYILIKSYSQIWRSLLSFLLKIKMQILDIQYG